eukprot:1178830-Prorocentrum_minimum.AAC.1
MAASVAAASKRALSTCRPPVWVTAYAAKASTRWKRGAKCPHTSPACSRISAPVPRACAHTTRCVSSTPFGNPAVGTAAAAAVNLFAATAVAGERTGCAAGEVQKAARTVRIRVFAAAIELEIVLPEAQTGIAPIRRTSVVAQIDGKGGPVDGDPRHTHSISYFSVTLRGLRALPVGYGSVTLPLVKGREEGLTVRDVRHDALWGRELENVRQLSRHEVRVQVQHNPAHLTQSTRHDS